MPSFVSPNDTLKGRGRGTFTYVTGNVIAL